MIQSWDSSSTSSISETDTETAASSEEDPLLFTFGAEIECVVSLPNEHWPGDVITDQEWIHGDYVRSFIPDVIQKMTNIPCRQILQSSGYKTWLVGGDLSIVPGDSPQDEERGYWGVEIVTRVLQYEDPSSFEEVNEFLKAIQNHPELTVMVNNSTGGHRHLGARDSDGNNCGFTFPTLRKFFIIVTAFEHLINTIVPEHRITNVYCRPPSHFAELYDQDVFQRVKKIQACYDWVSLHDVTIDRSAFNLMSLTSSKRTIEFRQFAGTIDPKEIEMEVRFAAGLLRFAHTASVPRMNELLRHVLNINWTFVDFANSIGIPEVGVYYLTRLHLHELAEFPKPWEERLPYLNDGLSLIRKPDSCPTFEDLRAFIPDCDAMPLIKSKSTVKELLEFCEFILQRRVEGNLTAVLDLSGQPVQAPKQWVLPTPEDLTIPSIPSVSSDPTMDEFLRFRRWVLDRVAQYSLPTCDLENMPQGVLEQMDAAISADDDFRVDSDDDFSIDSDDDFSIDSDDDFSPDRDDDLNPDREVNPYTAARLEAKKDKLRTAVFRHWIFGRELEQGLTGLLRHVLDESSELGPFLASQPNPGPSEENYMYEWDPPASRPSVNLPIAKTGELISHFSSATGYDALVEELVLYTLWLLRSEAQARMLHGVDLMGPGEPGNQRRSAAVKAKAAKQQKREEKKRFVQGLRERERERQEQALREFEVQRRQQEARDAEVDNQRDWERRREEGRREREERERMEPGWRESSVERREREWREERW